MTRCFRYSPEGVLVECDDMGERFLLREPSEFRAVECVYVRHAIRVPARGTVGLYLRAGEPVRQAYLDDIAREFRR